MELDDIFDYDTYLADSCGDGTTTGPSPTTDSDEQPATTNDASAGTSDIQNDDGGSSTPVAPVLDNPASHPDAPNTVESAPPSTPGTTRDVGRDATTAAPPPHPTQHQQNTLGSGREHAVLHSSTQTAPAVGPSQEDAATTQQRLYAPPPRPPPGYLQPLPVDSRLYPNGGRPHWQGGSGEAHASTLGLSVGGHFAGNATFSGLWNAQPGYTVPATYQYPSADTPLLVPWVLVPSQGPAPPRAGPSHATGSNVRYQPYPTALGTHARRDAGPVGRQPTLRWRAPVVAPDYGQAAMPDQPQTQWHFANAGTYQNGFSQLATPSAHYLLGRSAQAETNSSTLQQQSQHAPPNGNAAPVASGSSQQAPAPAAPVALQPPEYDYSGGQLHRCPVCVANPKAKTSQKQPLNGAGMKLHYRRLHCGYRELHGEHAECVFCGKRLAVARPGHFRDHRRQKRKADCAQVPCAGIARLGGTGAHAAIRAFLREKGVPLDHWQIAEDKALMAALLEEEDGDEEDESGDADAMKEE